MSKTFMSIYDRVAELDAVIGVLKIELASLLDLLKLPSLYPMLSNEEKQHIYRVEVLLND